MNYTEVAQISAITTRITFLKGVAKCFIIEVLIVNV